MINELWLTTFKTLVELEHFTKTAQLLNMTQPGVSQHIRKLEDSLGYSLINRVGKSFELTREGEILYEYALKKNEQEITLFDKLRIDSEYEGDIKIACSGTVAMILYPLFLERQKKYPKLNISIEAAPNDLIEKKVLNNEADIGVITNGPSSHELFAEHIGREELCLIYSKCFKNLDLKNILNIGFIDHPDGRSYLERVLKSNNIDPKKRKEIKSTSYINQINQILLPVSLGLGFTIMPKRYVSNFSKGLNISIYPKTNTVYDEYFLIRKNNKVLGRKYEWFMSCLKEQLQVL